MNLIFVLILTAFLQPNPPAETYILVSKPSAIVGCGGILFAGQYYFIKAQDSSSVIGIILCPDGLGNDFFKEDAKYTVAFSADSTLPFGYSYMNEYFNGVHIKKRIITDIKPDK